MKKYSFLVYHKEYNKFLQDIQELGVLHVNETVSGEIENEELRESYQLLHQINDNIKFLQKRNVEQNDNSGDKEGENVIRELIDLRTDKEQYIQQLTVIKKELSILEPWGDFSWESIQKLSDAGLRTRFFICPLKRYEEELKDNFYIEKINELSGHIYFVLFEKQNEPIEIDAEEVQLPKKTLTKIKSELESLNNILDKSEGLFDKYASKYIPLLQRTADNISGQLSFDKVILNTRKEAEEKLMILEGWVPKDKVEPLEKFLNKEAIYFESENPTTEDEPPIKLKNNKFAKLYEAIGELYTFPNYGELDLTPFFAPFYMLFFGFCLGDAGYGLLITLGTIYGLSKVKPKLRPLLKLGMYLGIATTVMGIVGGTFFGIMILKVNWEWVKGYQEFILNDDQMMVFALGLGYIQVLFGMFIKAANKARMYGFKYSISQLGWNIIVMVTLPAFALGKFEIIDKSLGFQIALISGIIGGFPAMFYNTPGKNPLLNLGVGLWDTYQTVSGLLGDVLSYIRLFALGISSAILGNVFNSLALQTKEGLSDSVVGTIFGITFMVIILAFGHSLNFFMAALGSFVHPLRLTFVEFYKNAGFIGGGKKYKPFSK